MSAISYAEIGPHDVKRAEQGGLASSAWSILLPHRRGERRAGRMNWQPAPVDAVNTPRRIRRSCHVFSRTLRHHE